MLITFYYVDDDDKRQHCHSIETIGEIQYDAAFRHQTPNRVSS